MLRMRRAMELSPAQIRISKNRNGSKLTHRAQWDAEIMELKTAYFPRVFSEWRSRGDIWDCIPESGAFGLRRRTCRRDMAVLLRGRGWSYIQCSDFAETLLDRFGNKYSSVTLGTQNFSQITLCCKYLELNHRGNYLVFYGVKIKIVGQHGICWGSRDKVFQTDQWNFIMWAKSTGVCLRMRQSCSHNRMEEYIGVCECIANFSFKTSLRKKYAVSSRCLWLTIFSNYILSVDHIETTIILQTRTDRVDQINPCVREEYLSKIPVLVRRLH